MPRQSQLDSAALAAAVVHEVRRLLTPARGYAELALRQPGLSADVSKSLMATIEAAIACDAAMECLVASRSESGPTDAASVVSNILRGHEDVHLQCTSIAAIPLADAAIEVLMSNLVNNARRASGPGKRIHVSVSDCSTGNAPHVRIEVADQGKGMTELERGRAMLPFVSNGASAGMGLAICRYLVERAGGSIEIETAAGNGTRVVICIPVAANAQRAA